MLHGVSLRKIVPIIIMASCTLLSVIISIRKDYFYPTLPHPEIIPSHPQPLYTLILIFKISQIINGHHLIETYQQFPYLEYQSQSES